MRYGKLWRTPKEVLRGGGEGHTPLPEVTELRTPKKPPTGRRQKVGGLR